MLSIIFHMIMAKMKKNTTHTNKVKDLRLQLLFVINLYSTFNLKKLLSFQAFDGANESK